MWGTRIIGTSWRESTLVWPMTGYFCCIPSEETKRILWESLGWINIFSPTEWSRRYNSWDEQLKHYLSWKTGTILGHTIIKRFWRGIETSRRTGLNSRINTRRLFSGCSVITSTPVRGCSRQGAPNCGRSFSAKETATKPTRVSGRLSNYIRQQRHEARTLDGFGQGALVIGVEARAAARHYFAVRIEKLLKKLGVFVINMLKLCYVFFFHIRRECRPG